MIHLLPSERTPERLGTATLRRRFLRLKKTVGKPFACGKANCWRPPSGVPWIWFWDSGGWYPGAGSCGIGPGSGNGGNGYSSSDSEELLSKHGFGSGTALGSAAANAFDWNSMKTFIKFELSPNWNILHLNASNNIETTNTKNNYNILQKLHDQSVECDQREDCVETARIDFGMIAFDRFESFKIDLDQFQRTWTDSIGPRKSLFPIFDDLADNTLRNERLRLLLWRKLAFLFEKHTGKSDGKTQFIYN